MKFLLFAIFARVWELMTMSTTTTTTTTHIYNSTTKTPKPPPINSATEYANEVRVSGDQETSRRNVYDARLLVMKGSTNTATTVSDIHNSHSHSHNHNILIPMPLKNFLLLCCDAT
ncbi:unnamed protein product [Ceratitis capitata]|uniref:(Mediterranean fruit fly) hypothetical protein n=1 Tax=Ceratitis capitata TaxID=7213 RepID=A0A811UZN6_CERCA|nr:unnamed protein product [Ceratitis capitata]